MDKRGHIHFGALSILIAVFLCSANSFSQEQWKQKVEASLLANLNSDATETFFVYVKGEPDLSAAYGIKDWNERGRFVCQRLTENAETTQAPVRFLLTQQRAVGSVDTYKSYWIMNCIEVQGRLAAVEALASMDEIGSFEYPPKGQLTDRADLMS